MKRCLNEVNTMELYLYNNTFIQNTAVNGGAIYIHCNNTKINNNTENKKEEGISSRSIDKRIIGKENIRRESIKKVGKNKEGIKYIKKLLSINKKKRMDEDDEEDGDEDGDEDGEEDDEEDDGDDDEIEEDNVNKYKDGFRNILLTQKNLFSNNTADDFGGAVYTHINYLSYESFINDTVSYNKAGVWGGGIFINGKYDREVSEIKDCNLLNNTISFLINNYSSAPYSIQLETKLSNNPIKIRTGDIVPLIFSLNDMYDHVIDDVTKYYSSMVLEVFMKKVSKIDSTLDVYNQYVFKDLDINKIMTVTSEPDFHLTGNIGSFINGIDLLLFYYFIYIYFFLFYKY